MTGPVLTFYGLAPRTALRALEAFQDNAEKQELA
jgi:hypothetical protein